METIKQTILTALLIWVMPVTGHTLPFLGGQIPLRVPQGAAFQWINGVSIPLTGSANFVFDYFADTSGQMLPSINIYHFGSFEFTGAQPVVVQPFLYESGDESSYFVDVIVTNFPREDPNFGWIQIRSHAEQGGTLDFQLAILTEIQLYDHVTGEFITKNGGSSLLSATDMRWSHTAPASLPNRESNPGGNFYITEPMHLTFVNDAGWATEIRQIVPIGIPEPSVDKLVLFCLLLFPLARRWKRCFIVPSKGHVE